MRTFRASSLLALVIGAFSAWPAAASDCLPTVNAGWVRLPPVPMPMLAGFGRIENGCAAPMEIVAASSPAFADVSVHQTSIVDGVSRMRAVPQLRIAPGGSAVLEPGGTHLMLMQPRGPLHAGDTVTIEFALKDGGVLRGEFELRKPGG